MIFIRYNFSDGKSSIEKGKKNHDRVDRLIAKIDLPENVVDIQIVLKGILVSHFFEYHYKFYN